MSDFRLGSLGLDHMQIHLISVEICVKRGANTLIESESSVLGDFHKKAHYTLFVQ